MTFVLVAVAILCALGCLLNIAALISVLMRIRRLENLATGLGYWARALDPNLQHCPEPLRVAFITIDATTETSECSTQCVEAHTYRAGCALWSD